MPSFVRVADAAIASGAVLTHETAAALRDNPLALFGAQGQGGSLTYGTVTGVVGINLASGFVQDSVITIAANARVIWYKATAITIISYNGHLSGVTEGVILSPGVADNQVKISIYMHDILWRNGIGYDAVRQRNLSVSYQIGYIAPV